MPDAPATQHRCSVRHSYPHLVDVFTIGFSAQQNQLRVDDTRTFFDLQDVFELVTNSQSHARKLVGAWRSGVRGKRLACLIHKHSPKESDFPPLTPLEIIRLKWSSNGAISSGRSRVCATARACVVLLNIITSSRHNQNLETAKRWFRALCDENTFPRTMNQGRRFSESSELIHENLRKIPDVAYENWNLTSEELEAMSEPEREGDADAESVASCSLFSSGSSTQADSVQL